MATDRANDLKAFRDFADARLAEGEADLTLDEALALWQYENSSGEEREETVRAIQCGLDDVEAGRTVDAFVFLERMRQKLESTGEQ